jgi:pantetheine-phosphate adenylyltransferase
MASVGISCGHYNIAKLLDTLSTIHYNAIIMKKRKTRGVYPGTFDPVTFGHIDLIHRALGMFDEVIVAVAPEGTDKRPFFSTEERVGFLKKATKKMGPRIRIEPFEGLVVNYARKVGASTMIRGIRMLSDFEYEFQMALTNRKLSGDIETIFLMPHEAYAYLSSRLIKEIALLGGDIHSFVPDYVEHAIRSKCKK